MSEEMLELKAWTLHLLANYQLVEIYFQQQMSLLWSGTYDHPICIGPQNKIKNLFTLHNITVLFQIAVLRCVNSWIM
jgi:hypothetical protein